MANQETINKARQLAEALNTARNDRDVLTTKINNPICGKPHQGFKAMRKLRPMLAVADANVVAIEAEIMAWLRIDSKASKERRYQRALLYGKVCAEIGA